MTFEDHLREVGDRGRYQVTVVLLTSFVMFSAGAHIMMTVFTMHLPDHRCTDPVDNDLPYNASNQWRELVLSNVSSLGPSAQKYGQTGSDDVTSVQYRVSSCHIEYKDFRNQNGIVKSVSLRDNMTGGDQWLSGDWTNDTNDSASAKCQSWVYDQSIFTSSIATQMNFVCERRLLASHALVMLMLGQMIGSALGGSAADIFGRKKVIMVSYLLEIVCGIFTALATNIFTLGAMYLLTGSALAASYCPAMTLVLEQVKPRCRHLVVILLSVAWTVGVLWVGFLAYLIRDWQHLQLALSVPELLFLVCVGFVPESPRWLADKGRFSEAEVILERIAKTNRKVLHGKIVLSPENGENPIQAQSMAVLFRCPPLLIRLLIVLFSWAACSLTYYGLSLGVGLLSGNIYLNYCLSAFTELAGYAFVTLALERAGRKKVYCVALLTGASACLLTVVPAVVGGAGAGWAVRVLALTGKFGVNLAFLTTWLHTPEMFPTLFRAGAVGACSSSARIGGVAASYLATLTVGGKVGSVLPQIIFGSVGFVAGLLALSLPETHRTQLPDSLEDAINMSKRKKESLPNGALQQPPLA